MTTYTTSLSEFDVHTKDGMSNILKSVRFTITGSNGQAGHKNTMPVFLDDPETNSFIEYADLTEEMVMQWVINKLGQEEIDALKNGIDAVLNAQPDPNAPPKVIRVSAPWAGA
jgi:hypothetical protein